MRVSDTLYAMIERGRESQNVGLKTGCSKMDSLTGGCQRGVYTLIFGLSGSGKSSYVLYNNIYRPLKDNPNEDIKIIYYSLEMSAELLLAKLMCLHIYEEYNYVISYSQLMSWQEILSDEAFDYVMKSKKWIESIQERLIIYDKSLSAQSFYGSMKEVLLKYGNLEDVGEGRTVYIKHNPNQWIFVIIDHLGLLRPSGSRKKKDEIDELSTYAVYFREKFNVSFYMLMQENRNSSNMDRKKAEMDEPSAEDTKDSGNPYNDQNNSGNLY